jgi:hypothetical protein
LGVRSTESKTERIKNRFWRGVVTGGGRAGEETGGGSGASGGVVGVEKEKAGRAGKEERREFRHSRWGDGNIATLMSSLLPSWRKKRFKCRINHLK